MSEISAGLLGLRREVDRAAQSLDDPFTLFRAVRAAQNRLRYLEYLVGDVVQDAMERQA